MDKGYLTVKEVAQYLGMKTSTVYAWVPEMPHYKIGNLLRFKKEDVDAWMDTKREGAEVPGASTRRTKNVTDVDNIVRKTIDAAKAKSYNLTGKSDHSIKGL
jgi:excisionase family DNA binding protein